MEALILSADEQDLLSQASGVEDVLNLSTENACSYLRGAIPHFAPPYATAAHELLCRLRGESD